MRPPVRSVRRRKRGPRTLNTYVFKVLKQVRFEQNSRVFIFHETVPPFGLILRILTLLSSKNDSKCRRSTLILVSANLVRWVERY